MGGVGGESIARPGYVKTKSSGKAAETDKMTANGSFTITATGNLFIQADRELLARIIAFATENGIVTDDRPAPPAERGGNWRFCIYGESYPDETLLEEITNVEFRSRYLWKSPEGEFIDKPGGIFGSAN